jgi:DNA-binding response OmpR family regulator
MRNERSTEACYEIVSDVQDVERRARRRRFEASGDVVDPWSYWAKRGLGTIRLTAIEYRILRFLAARPNEACTRQRIVAAVSTSSHCVTVETLADYIHSLRGRLGFYSDYIQSVPYIGYRFKA